MPGYSDGRQNFLLQAAIDRLTSDTIGSIATTSSSYFPIGGPQRYGGSVLGGYFQNGTTSSATSGTTTGSSASFVLYKNASNAASIIATFNGSGTNVATLASAVLLISGTAGTTNASFVAGDQLIGEVRGGVANNGSQAGASIVVDAQYNR